MSDALSPHCHYCGKVECFEGRFWTVLCPENIEAGMSNSEIVMFVGYPASGKSSAAKPYFKTHTRLNRDILGGKLSGVAAKLKELLEAGQTRFVLDNTYATKKHRAEVVSIAKKHGVPVKVIWMKTSIEDAQFNAATRMYREYGRLLENDEIAWESKSNPNCFPVAVLFAFRKAFEKPTMDEGFESIKEVKFQRILPDGHINKALILDYDGTLRDTKSGDKYPTHPDDVAILPGRKEVLQRYKDDGYLLLGVSNQSGVRKGVLSAADADACFDRTNELLGFDIDYLYCPHASFPIACYCRKPMPGFGVVHIEKYKLDPSQCIMVGDMTSDKTFAKRSGFQFQHASEFFA